MPDLNLGHSVVCSTVGARAVANAIHHKAYDPNKLSPTYALLSRMRWSSSTDVLASAEQVIQHIISTYSEPNLAPEEFKSRAAKREDPLREFSRICGAELEAIQKP
jgi:hypothetical protein